MTQRRTATYCRICEAACGLIATVTDGVLTGLEPDREHPVSRGFACAKGLAAVHVNTDADRLRVPLERISAADTRERSWDAASDAIADRLSALVNEHGPQAVGVFLGNPAGFNSLLGVGTPEVFARLGVDRIFSSGTQDTMNKYAASAAVYGSSLLHPLPDVRNADAVLLLGSNWRVSKGTLISMPNAYNELVGAASRGARIWFVDPRRTESSGRRTGEAVQIKPDTDAYFLAALLCEIDRTTGFVDGLSDVARNIDGLREFVRRYPPERVADVCGLDARTIRTIAREFAAAPRACAYMATGVNMGRQGTLAYWLLQMLVLVTGNLDTRGGNIPGQEVYPYIARGRADLEAELVRGEFGDMRRGHLPGVLLADYILDAAEPIRALFVMAGNPLLSIPGEDRLREALKSLELLVVVDIYPNATSDDAHWLLPATDQYEREDINLALPGMQPDPFVHWSPRVVAPRHGQREEWWILARLARSLGQPSVLDEADPRTARWKRVDHMLARGGLSRAQVTGQPRGIAVGGGLRPGALFSGHVHTSDGLVDCRPAAFGAAIERLERFFGELRAEPEDQLKLITRRSVKWHNSWYANVPSMKAGTRDRNRLGMNPGDAGRRGVGDGDLVRVTSAYGALTVTAQLDETLRPGVVSLEHGWGLQRGLALSRAFPGANVNRLTPHGPGSYEPVSNQAQLTGVPVEVALAPEEAVKEDVE
ncbi:molybdopterin-containing oxidoreductase family protein [Streptomyces viridosporus]|uniref:molybdopterin-containing oxidoreductase family protein n=1 Tax=Streptomyces viridosporus TaxID=67581 RepID=UPI0009C02279|nr:molybdopterin-dependent oxidoreductase [Streptomyces viridosporus]